MKIKEKEFKNNEEVIKEYLVKQVKKLEFKQLAESISAIIDHVKKENSNLFKKNLTTK